MKQNLRGTVFGSGGPDVCLSLVVDVNKSDDLHQNKGINMSPLI